MIKNPFIGVKILVLTVLCCFHFTVLAIEELNLTDARSFALGNLHALSHESVNPAALSFSDQLLGASVLNQFEMKELNTSNLWLKYPNRYLDAGITFSHFGYEDYRIVQMQAGFAKKIIPELSLGINLLYFRKSSFWEENAANRLSSCIGIVYQSSKTVEFSFLAENILHNFPYRLWKLYGGMDYRVLENCSLLLESGYNANKQFDFSLGIEYELLDKIWIRAGTQIILKMPSFGVGYKWKNWTVDAGFSLHPVLGTSSMIAVTYLLKTTH
ncbi:MAG: hypothetical protein LBH32_08210 [Dysgonamonadaceae bacterium]|jgi:hypothetical protein|nr:hypothetical protein [Dysgonamonadaceae bacterium]